jgi:DNA polymerase-3 subunit alpha
MVATLERQAGPDDAGADAAELLWHWLREGWRYRGIGDRPRVERDWFEERVQYEMSLITSKDFCDFFCATSEALRWAKDNGIVVGPGRGSSAASVVCYLTRITEIDPYQYPGLVFERFMDVTRTDEPDIDVDIEDTRRHEVREHMEDKYGADCVGTIANFVRYRAKNSLDDVAKVHEVPAASTKIVKALIIERSGGDSRFSDSLADTAEMFPNAAAIFDAFPALWLATRLEGNVRGMSVHAAGLVVANGPITDICAVYEREDKKTKTIRQVLSIDKYDVGYAGMLKLDMLGLTTLGMIARCLKLIGLTLEDLYAISDTDQDTLDLFQRNDVIGVFQFEGRATRIICGDVYPENFAQVADINALARPGPLFSGTTADYIETKHGRRKRDKYHPLVDAITDDTFGCIVYQEQILKILQTIGGFDWTDLNAIRNIIAKKAGQAALHANMQNFQDGALRLHGIKSADSELIWKRLVTSGTYAFNIAHAISYSKLAWWTAYLKAHYPAEFFAASLYKSKPGKDAEFKLMKDSQRHGIEILPPDFRYSDTSWSAIMPQSKNPGVLAGFSSVPGIAGSIADNIIAARKEQAFIVPADMTRARGVGDKKIEVIEKFCKSEDPFELEVTRKMIDKVRAAIKCGELDAPLPLLDGEDVARAPAEPWRSKKKGQLITYAGRVKARIYQDIVENIHSRTGDDLDEILKNLKDPLKRKYCTLQCFDASMEEVYGRFNRYNFPQFRRRLEAISVGSDVVIIQGRKSPGFGNSIAVEGIWVIDPE